MFGCSTHQSNPLEPLLQFFLRLTFPQHPLQPADQLRRKLLRLNVNILWHPVCALMGKRQCESVLKVTIHIQYNAFKKETTAADYTGM